MNNVQIFSTLRIGAILGLGSVAFLLACGSGSSSSTASCVADPTSTVICVTPPVPADSQHANQGVTARVGFYQDATCTPGTEVMTLNYDLSQTCFGWRRQASTSTHDNSATNFQCYRDRVCYTQYTKVLTCDTTATDKQFSSDTCTLDDSGGVWLKLLSGTESCPVAPAGFTCPLSDPGNGTTTKH